MTQINSPNFHDFRWFSNRVDTSYESNFYSHSSSTSSNFFSSPSPSLSSAGPFLFQAERTQLVYGRHTSRQFPLQLKGGQSHAHRYYSIAAEIQFVLGGHHRQELRKIQWTQFRVHLVTSCEEFMRESLFGGRSRSLIESFLILRLIQVGKARQENYNFNQFYQRNCEVFFLRNVIR